MGNLRTGGGGCDPPYELCLIVLFVSNSENVSILFVYLDS